MAVRNTYPDVTDRLLSYSDDKGRERTISDDYRSAKVVPFLMEDNTMVVFRKAVDAGKYIAKDYQAKTDLLPLIRLAIGRMLYPRSKAKTTCREWNEEINTPAKESLHLQFAFRLYTLPVYYWLLLVSLVFLNLDVSQEQQDKSALAFLISCLSLWIAFTVWQHSRIATRWRNWLGLYSKRPLGRLPVFLYCPQNDPQYRWEELDDFDFIDHLSEYIVDSEKFINITIGLFAILLLTIMQVVG